MTIHWQVSYVAFFEVEISSHLCGYLYIVSMDCCEFISGWAYMLQVYGYQTRNHHCLLHICFHHFCSPMRTWLLSQVFAYIHFQLRKMIFQAPCLLRRSRHFTGWKITPPQQMVIFTFDDLTSPIWCLDVRSLDWFKGTFKGTPYESLWHFIGKTIVS